VDLDDTGGITTLISVNNGLASPGLARLILWTDWGVPTLAFDLYLGPTDIQTISLRSVFEGEIPSTGTPAAVLAYPFCSIFPPYHDNPALSGDRVEQLRAAHTGGPGPIDGLCYGADHGDSIARGYVTVDSVNICGGLESLSPRNTPANPLIQYFLNDEPGAMANDLNMLWGDVFFVDDRNNSAHGTEAVALWADAVRFADSDIFTFFGRFTDWAGHDDRVPLPDKWIHRYLDGGPFAGGAEIIVFRHPNHAESAPRTCGTAPDWYPLQSTVTTRDEDGKHVVEHDPNLFGLVTQKVSIGGLEPAPFAAFGVLSIVGDADQMWVQPVLTGRGRFGVGLNATAVDSLCGTIPPSTVHSSASDGAAGAQVAGP
jgi:hypothetical protein